MTEFRGEFTDVELAYLALCEPKEPGMGRDDGVDQRGEWRMSRESAVGLRLVGGEQP